MMVDAVDREAELEEVTDALLLTRSDDFNAVAAAELRGELGTGTSIESLPTRRSQTCCRRRVRPASWAIAALTFAELSSRFAAGARIVLRPADGSSRPTDARTELPLFSVASDGGLSIAADGSPPVMRAGDTVIVLAPAKLGDRAPPRDPR